MCYSIFKFCKQKLRGGVLLTTLVALLSLIISFKSLAQVKNEYRITSPDKQTVIEAGIDKAGDLTYSVNFNGIRVINTSALGLVLNGLSLGQNTSILNHSETKHQETISWPLGENDKIENNYNELNLQCQLGDVQFNIIVRLFNGSVALRYRVPRQLSVKTGAITKELTAFNFNHEYLIYQYNQESVFTPTLLNELIGTCDFPATLTSKGNLYASVGEADNFNYYKAELTKGRIAQSLRITFNTDSIHTSKRIVKHRDTIVRFAGDFKTPWRTISFAKTAIGLHNFSALYLKLTDALTPGTPTGIVPGKLIRAQLNTQSGLDCIDFAASHNFQYVMFDAGWYGAEFRTTSDPTKVINQIDMPRVIAYGKQKNIGTILYVNYVGLKAKIDTLLPLFKTWGVSGIKFGFVNGLTQKGIAWLDTAMRKVNDAGFILDIHDNYKPTGLSRKYPYLLTQEGIRGDENSPDAFHTTTLPFTRFLAGPADFTFCYPNSKNAFSKNLKVSKAQQLALSVIYFSPLQSIFWYGNPLDYTNEAEIEFFTKVPTVWNETIYLAGDIGKNISVARRNKDTWFIGNAAGLEDWKSTMKLDFLDKNKSYQATIYADDGGKGISIRAQKVKRNVVLSIDIKAKGGQAIILSPVN